MAIMVLLCAMGIYIVCVLLDKVRLLLFKALKIDTFINHLGDTIDNLVDEKL